MSIKRNRVRLSLPTEGWIYLVILVFVSVCAVLRNVNLLIIISGMMFAPLFMCWRISRHMIRNAVVKRIVPHRLHVGQIVSVQWKVTNLSQIPFWYIKIADKIRLVAQTNQNNPKNKDRRNSKQLQQYSQASVVLNQIATGKAEFASYRCLFTRRGQYEAGPALVSTVFPMGLIRSWFRIADKESFFVAPRLGKLRPDWDRRLESLVYGNESVRRRRGSEQDEFYALRPWRSGDNMRQIHWRTTAKYGRPMVRQFDQKSNRDMAIVLDLWIDRDPYFSFEHASENCELILSFAATLLTQTGDSVKGRIGFAVAGLQTHVFSTRSHVHFTPAVLRHLATAIGGTNPDVLNAITSVQACVSPGTPCFVISTRSMSGDEIAQLLGPLARRSAQNSIRWLAYDSPEFGKLFSVDDPHSKRQLAKLKDDVLPVFTKQPGVTGNVEAENVST